MMFRNERTLYKRPCDLCKEVTVSVIAEDKPYIVYCPACWFSDAWDPLAYGVEYDPSKTFFEQLKELTLRVPQVARAVTYATLVNSEYVNHAAGCKNCMLIFNADFCENAMYGSALVHTKDSMDCYVGDHLDFCYEVTDAEQCSRCYFCKSIDSCVNTLFSRDCTGCIDCFGCCNLRKKSYCAFNKQLSPEEYKKLVDSYNLDTYEGILRAKKDTEAFFKIQPKRCVYGMKNDNVIGDYIYHSKNARYCWSGQYYENCAYCQFSTLPHTRATYDLTEWGQNAENCVDVITVGEGAHTIRYSFGVWSSVKNIEYSLFCTSGASDLFGCTGLRRKQYCILNKQYDKETYEKLREQIIKDMQNNPYRDSQNRIWTYGEFMPYDLSYYDYNESFAQQHFPLTKEQALEKGFSWRDVPPSTYTTTCLARDLPQAIADVQDSITKEIIACQVCTKAYRIVPQELEYLRRFLLPLPRSCHACRQDERIHSMGSHILHPGFCKCQNTHHDKHAGGSCTQTFMTQYDALDIVYCESCYQEEIL